MSADRLVRVRRTRRLALVTALTRVLLVHRLQGAAEVRSVGVGTTPWRCAATRRTPCRCTERSRRATPCRAPRCRGTIDSMASIAEPGCAPTRARCMNGRKYYTDQLRGLSRRRRGRATARSSRPRRSSRPFRSSGPRRRRRQAPMATSGAMIRNGRGADAVVQSHRGDRPLGRRELRARTCRASTPVAIGPVGLPGETGDKVPGYSQSGPTRPSPYYDHVGSQAGPWPTGMGIT